ncbi:hypothetical protein Tco_1133056 [Tanacetum coccineum]|uniref:Uncharacterized protein n=1 Tax=Tanacetum coccineum TaxID=301880 RepID=A0ABQ5JF58_9ASTR
MWNRLMVRVVEDVHFYERNSMKICLRIVLKMEFSKIFKILPNHPMTIPVVNALLRVMRWSSRTRCKVFARSSQIDHNCCYECGDSLDGIFCQQCICKFCGKGAYYQLVDREIKEIINDLGYKRFRGEEIDEEYERDCEIRIRKLKQDFNIWGSEVRKKEQAYEEEKYYAACRYMLSITCDDEDDYIPSGDIIARKSITPDYDQEPIISKYRG